MPRVVIGNGPDGLRAAAVRATRGEAVVLLQERPTANGLEHPELPVGTARFSVAPHLREDTEQVLGALVEAPGPDLAVLVRGQVLRLPMSPVSVPRLFAPHARVPAARAWARARGRNSRAEILGGGQEERTHRDWVIRRMGGPAWHHLYRDYAERRWGVASDQLSASVAHVYHSSGRVYENDESQDGGSGNGVDGRGFQVVGGGYDEALAVAERGILAHGGEIRTGVDIQGLVLEDGRVVAVDTGDGRLAVEGTLWTTASPGIVAKWVGEHLSEGLRSDAAAMDMRSALRIAVKGPVDGLPWEIHVLDEGAPFWRVVVPYGVEETAIFHVTLGKDGSAGDAQARVDDVVAAADSLGLGRFVRDSARVEYLDQWQPIWRPCTHARHRHLLLAWRNMGIVGVGRGGAFRGLDEAEEIELALEYRDAPDPDQREVHRALIEPPVRLNDLDARITRFVAR